MYICINKTNKMKDHQFEEIIASLSIIISVLCYEFGIYWLCILFSIKAVWDFYWVFKESYLEAKKELEDEAKKL